MKSEKKRAFDFLSLFTLLSSLFLSPALAQPLLCPPVASAAGKPCETFHFHVQLFRPEQRDFIELYGIDQFASVTSCERARDAAFKRNMSVVEYMHTQRRDWWQADKFGPCHCDMTVEKASPNFLSEAARTQQLRDAEEIRQRVRERLIDAKALPDSEVMRNIAPPLSATPLIGGPKFVSMPAPVAAATASNSPEDLQITKAVDKTPSSTTSEDLPLVDIPLPGITPPAEVVAATPAPVPAPVPPSTDPPKPAPAPLPQQTVQVAAEPVTVADEPDLPAPEDVADAFVSYESQRIQNVLKVDVGDESIKAQVLEACTQRIQLLSNLRSIIVGSGAKSRLVAAANGAKKESERVAVAAKLFGSDIPPHWAPKDAANVIFDPGVTEPERVLRDAAASDEQKRHALYALLATSSPTEQQQMWLSSVIEGLLK